MRYFFRVEYDGSQFGGWQRQPNATSIQQILEESLSLVLRTAVAVTGAGRTDAGVHAAGQGAHFDVPEKIDIKRCEFSVNSLIPTSIAIYNLCQVENSFHARFSAVQRRYRYYISERKRPLYYQRAWTLYHAIDWNLVSDNISQLFGTHDFSSFCASGCGSDNMVCSVSTASLDRQDDFYVFTIEANRFIYKMVRSITGTLVDIGRGQINASIEQLIGKKDRRCCGQTAPASGLVLDYVTYLGDTL